MRQQMEAVKIGITGYQLTMIEMGFIASFHSWWSTKHSPLILLTYRVVFCCVACLQRIPERIIERAVKGMLPKGRLGRDIKLHLKVYKGTGHPHEAQQPTDITNRISAKPAAAQ